MAPNRNPIDFSTANPPRAVTDPLAQERVERGLPPVDDPNYPCHLVKPDLEGPGGPAHREVVTAANEAEARRYRAQGYINHHEADIVERNARGAPVPPAARLVPARKPANRKPRAPKAS